MARHPVTDWMNDFDHHDPRWVDDPFVLWAEMREAGGVATTKRFGGVFCPLSWSGVRQVATDFDSFSSRHVVIGDEQTLPPDFAPPVTSDPPRHRPARSLLAQHLSASRVAALEPAARQDCRGLIASARQVGTVDAVAGYARPAVSRTIARVLGVSAEAVVSFRSLPLASKLALIRSEIAAASVAEGEGLVAHLVRALRAGEVRDETHLIGHVYLLLIASLDTTAAVISAALLHLAENVGDQSHLRGRPERIGTAIEEFLRVFAPVSTARVVTRDTEIEGCPVGAGSMALLAFAAANRDPARFDDPDRVLLDRPIETHAAFGFGIHHCAGAKLARMLIGVALDEWFAGIGEFRRLNSVPLKWTGGGVRALRRLPLTWEVPRGDDPAPERSRADAADRRSDVRTAD